MPDLDALVSSHLQAALADELGAAAVLVVRDGVLRQSVLALREGAELAEHNSPHAASIQVLVGRVRVTGEDSPVLAAGQLHTLTHQRHAVIALEDSVFLLTTVTSQPGSPPQGD